MSTLRARLLCSALLLSLAATGAVAQETPSPAPAIQTPPVETQPASNPASGEEPTPDNTPDAAPVAAPETSGDDEDETPAEPAIPAEWAPVPTDAADRSAYGLYLAGKAAVVGGEGELGARYLAEAHALAPEQPRLREQAFTSALLTGDLAVAARVAPGEGSPAMVQGGQLVQVVQTFAGGDARAANAALAAEPIGAPHARAALLISPWIAAAAGDWERALVPPPQGADPATTAFVRQNRALLLEHRRRYDEAEAELKSLTEGAITGPVFRRPYGEFLERRGRRDEARALYEAAAKANELDLALARALERVEARGRAPAMPTLREGAAEAMSAAAAQASAEGGHEFAAVYLRLALDLDRNSQGETRLAQVLTRAGLDDQARRAWSQVGTEDPVLFANARTQLAISLDEDGRPEDALQELRRAAAAAPSDPRIALVLAGQLAQAERYDEALAILNGPVLNTADQGAQVRFIRGAAYESLGRIPEAEAELWAALQAAPNDANMLNYLGYLWVDRGLRVEEGAALIARAHAAEPRNGNIQDSLGWAHFRQGRFDEAVATLEQAVAKEPANAEIVDHLGDAYWRVGRQREAEWQWERVLTLEPDAERRAGVETKLERGLPDDGAASTGVSR